jgi:hypothetical protein
VRATQAVRDPLEPIATTVGWLITLLVALLLLSLLVRQSLWGNGPVCASVSSNDASIFSGPVSVPGVAAGSHATLGSVSICASRPAAALRLAGLLAAWPYVIVWLVFLVRLRRVLKSAARPGGLYSGFTAARLRTLGWLLIIGGLAASIIESAAKISIFTSVVRYPGLGWFEPWQVNFSFTTLIIGLALVTAARVMGQGVTMREELDVTI